MKKTRISFFLIALTLFCTWNSLWAQPMQLDLPEIQEAVAGIDRFYALAENGDLFEIQPDGTVYQIVGKYQAIRSIVGQLFALDDINQLHVQAPGYDHVFSTPINEQGLRNGVPVYKGTAFVFADTNDIMNWLAVTLKTEGAMVPEPGDNPVHYGSLGVYKIKVVTDQGLFGLKQDDSINKIDDLIRTKTVILRNYELWSIADDNLYFINDSKTDLVNDPGTVVTQLAGNGISAAFNLVKEDSDGKETTYFVIGDGSDPIELVDLVFPPEGQIFVADNLVVLNAQFDPKEGESELGVVGSETELFYWDLNPLPGASSNPQGFLHSGNQVFFTAFDGKQQRLCSLDLDELEVYSHSILGKNPVVLAALGDLVLVRAEGSVIVQLVDKKDAEPYVSTVNRSTGASRKSGGGGGGWFCFISAATPSEDYRPVFYLVLLLPVGLMFLVKRKR